MRSLFFKIFAWFWLANVIVVGMLIATIGPPRDPNRKQFQDWAGDMLHMYGDRALSELNEKGTPAAQAYVKQVRERTGLQVFVLDTNGRDILGQVPPEGALDAATRAKANRGSELHSTWNRRLLVAAPARLDGDSPHVFVGQLPGPPSLFFASTSRTLLRGAAAVALAGILCYGLGHYLTAPLRNLRSSARALAGGNLSTRVGPGVERRHDEIGDLGHDFNFMAERIESLVSSQQRLILDISHELRSPLARLNLALGLAVQRAGPAAQSALDRIDREAGRLNAMIERMLILARLENREAAREMIRIDLACLVKDTVADAQFESHGLTREAALVRCDPCTIDGVPHLLRSAVDNVIRNALRYTTEHSQVEVSLQCQSDPSPAAIIRVRDHGPGVPDELLEHIFRPFCRVGDDRNPQTGGVGLGLAIARQALLLHGGTIHASNAPDGGLIVEISIPQSAAPACPAQPAVS